MPKAYEKVIFKSHSLTYSAGDSKMSLMCLHGYQDGAGNYRESVKKTESLTRQGKFPPVS